MSDKNSKGLLLKIKRRLDRNRLGELLVSQGRLSPQDLKSALSRQSQDKIPLGQLLVQSGLIKRRDIVSAMTAQWTMRGLAAVFTLMIALSAFNIRTASAQEMTVSASFASAAAVAPLPSYPELFGTDEKKSGDLTAFTKWNTMFTRFDSEVANNYQSDTVSKWKANLEAMKALPLDKMITAVNDMANRVPYINDSKNWGKSDYWETPVEFFSKGGDCEDFAIAKYASLRALGVPDNRLRVAIVKDMHKGIPHAILIVYTDHGPVVLDNQIKTVTAENDISHYKPIFSINRTAWWLHVPSHDTLVASR